MYEIWEKDKLLADESDFASALDESTREPIERHRIVLYASFLSSAKTWSRFNDEVLKLRKGQRIIHGGPQLASDNMVQGELRVIPLTSTMGYQANTHVIVHFDDGTPDMGRKVFHPELTKLADGLAARSLQSSDDTCNTFGPIQVLSQSRRIANCTNGRKTRSGFATSTHCRLSLGVTESACCPIHGRSKT
jgi:hypothetical protein